MFNMATLQNIKALAKQFFCNKEIFSTVKYDETVICDIFHKPKR